MPGERRAGGVPRRWRRSARRPRRPVAEAVVGVEDPGPQRVGQARPWTRCRARVAFARRARRRRCPVPVAPPRRGARARRARRRGPWPQVGVGGDHEPGGTGNPAVSSPRSALPAGHGHRGGAVEVGEKVTTGGRGVSGHGGASRSGASGGSVAAERPSWSGGRRARLVDEVDDVAEGQRPQEAAVAPDGQGVVGCILQRGRSGSSVTGLSGSSTAAATARAQADDGDVR